MATAESFGELVGWFFSLMQTKFSVYGFDISFWDVAIYILVTLFIGRIIVAVFAKD